ncbi:MAG: DUF2461 domain-containing protein [Ignavibacteria bacterium]|nr:DUF2461 domain-containing protein [Ignavibacteria bacterium]
MKTKNTANDFPQVTIDFLTRLSRNNNREWFESHRQEFEMHFLEPAQKFVLEMGSKLQDIAPQINAIPKIDQSIFRIHRDVRFSKDKAPYKTNLGIYFWEGTRKKMDSSGFYFHIEPKLFFIGVGMYMLSKEDLKKFRDAVADQRKGKELHTIVTKLTKNKKFKLGGESYKKIPKGYPDNLPRSKYLLHSGLYLYYEDDHSKLLKSNPVSFTFKIFKDMLPLHNWFVKNI